MSSSEDSFGVRLMRAGLEALREQASKCRSGCPTQDHASWGECARASNFHTLVGDDVHNNRQMEQDLQAYRDVRRQGLQPQSVRRPFVEATKQAADA